MKRILIGTKNEGKLCDWKNRLPNYELLSLKSLGINLEVEEDLISLKNNSIKKAKTYAKESGFLTLSEDIGFFIKKLGGKPGVSVKRWGGELSKELSEGEFLDFFQKKISKIDDTSSYFLTFISIAKPNKEIKTISHKTEGYIDKSRLDLLKFDEGYPLSKVFVRNGRKKTWAEMNKNEKINDEKELIRKVKKSLEDFL